MFQSPSGAADLTGVWAVADSLAPLLGDSQVVVIKSTVPVGTNAALAERLELPSDTLPQGERGVHSDELRSLWEEMTMVRRSVPGATW